MATKLSWGAVSLAVSGMGLLAWAACSGGGGGSGQTASTDLAQTALRCVQSAPQQCYDAAKTVMWGAGYDLGQAQDYLDIACQGEIGAACRDFGLVTARATAVPPPNEAPAPRTRSREEVEAYTRACLLADGQGCHELGLCYQDGAGCEADPTQAYQRFGQGCDLTFAESCLEQGDMVAADATLTARPASDFYKLGCGHGSLEGCQRLADAVGAQSQSGDLERSLDLQVVAVGLENGCNVQRAESCYTLGQLYDRGWGVSRDPVRSQDLIDLACRMGYAPACHETALRQTIGHQALTADPQSGMHLLAELCETGYVPSCASLLEHAETIEQTAASLEDLDIRSPSDVARWTCDLGYQLGCDAGQVLER